MVAACSSPHEIVDATAAGDGPCGGEVFFTGELVDWDSSDTQFCGVFAATLQVRGDPTRVDHTNPNGRFQLCLASAATTLIDVTPPTGPSECTVPQSTYAVPGVLVASKAVIATGAVISARTFTAMRAAAFGFDAAKAQVLVHVDGTPRAVSITGTHDPMQVFDAAWSAGSIGANVYIPNVDPAGGTTTVSVDGGAVGTGSVPVAAGAFTYVTVVVQ